VNELATIENAQRFAAMLLTAAADMQLNEGGWALLKLDQDSGLWKFGQENIPLDPTSRLAVNPLSFLRGYIAFHPFDNDVVVLDDGTPANFLRPLHQPLMRSNELPQLQTYKKGREEKTPPWKEQVSVTMAIIGGDDAGTELRYCPVSDGGLKMNRKLIVEIGRRCADGGSATPVPIIEVFSSWYMDKQYNKKIYKPEFKIVEWVALDQTTIGERHPAPQPQENLTPKERIPPSTPREPDNRGTPQYRSGETRGVETVSGSPFLNTQGIVRGAGRR
jgi:hypothetical protein